MPPTPGTTTGCTPDKFTAECIAGVAYVAGFRDRPTLERAVAIALAESSGRVKVVNSIGCCVGLWQINVKVHKQYTTAQMQDPQQNANAAWAISNEGRNWKPWESFTNGSYLLHIPAAKIGVSKFYERNSINPDDSPVPDFLERPWEQGQETLSQLSDLATFPAKVLAWISDRNNIIRVIKVVTGVVIAVVGVALIVKPVRDTGTKVIGVAATKKVSTK